MGGDIIKKLPFCIGTVFILSLLCIMGTGCITDDNPMSITGSGKSIELMEDFSDFSEIEIGHAFKAVITKSEDYSVLIRIDDNIVDKLEVEKIGNRLKISLKSGYTYNNIMTMEVDITVPDLTSLSLSGASKATLIGFDFNHSLECDLSGATQLNGYIKTGDLLFEISGASKIDLNGEGNDIEINVSGASTVEMRYFSVGDLDFDISGASSVSITANGFIEGELSGASILNLYGNGELGNINLSGSSSFNNN